MTRAGRRRDPYDGDTAARPSALYTSRLVASIAISGADTESAPPYFIAKTLVENGMCVYIPASGEWAEGYPVGRMDRYGFPTGVRVRTERGISSPVLRVPQDALVFPANALRAPIAPDIRAREDMLNFLAVALRSNVDATKAGTLIRYSDPTMKAQVEQAVRDVKNGAPVVSLQSAFADDVKIEQLLPSSPSIVQDLLAAWVNTTEELDALTGLVRIGEKEERRTREEIEGLELAAEGTAVGVIIDTFNAYAEWYGVDAVARYAAQSKKEDAINVDATRSTPVPGEEPRSAEHSSD